jgi:hypothetical protein
MSLHAAYQPEIGLSFRLGDPLPRHDGAQHDGHQRNHYQASCELGGDELPPDQDDHNDAEFDDQIGRGELERHRRDEIGPLTKYRTGQRDSRVGAG